MSLQRSESPKTPLPVTSASIASRTAAHPLPNHSLAAQDPGARAAAAAAITRGGRLGLFRISPPYTERVVLRSSAPALHELPFGSVLGLDVSATPTNWTEIESAVNALRRQCTIAPVVLQVDPRADDLLYIAARVARLPVRAVLFGGESTSLTLRQQMTHPAGLPEDVVEWLALRGTRLTPVTAHLIRQIFTHAISYPEIVPLLRDLGNPESSARFRCRKKRLPSPGRWLHAARALRTAFRIQAEPGRSLLALAHELGYADHSALSNQMHRIFRLRPGEIRRVLGWEWLLDRWLTAESSKGRSAPGRSPANG